MDANQDITDVTPSTKLWGCKVILIEKLNERQSARGVTYRAMIMEDSKEDVHWIEGQLQVLEAGDITFFIGCNSCNRKVNYIEGINFKCMLCGDPEAKTIKRFRILAEMKDELSALQVTLFTDTLEKIVRALELNTPMEFIKCVDLNNSLESQKVTAAVKLPPRTEQTSASKTFSVQCLYDLRDEKTASPTLKRKLKVEEPSPKKQC
ncbi:unnamed protein product [Cuscuta campestris]|uniref:Replication factor A C-terminal domain-containing protein n=1 Tax=Cuscuta campestris TaxID=132261 RepID=A0A484LBC1_9ASTE|nr:unnamed protein product [Cuscuta campestris]